MAPLTADAFFSSPALRCLPNVKRTQPVSRCSNMTRAPRPGLCDTTEDDVGDCTTGSSGSWRVRHHPDASKGEVRDLDDCIAKCCSCDQCNFVSISTARAHMECSWYHACDDLQPSPPTGGYLTVAARAPSGERRAAIQQEALRARQCKLAREDFHRAHSVSLGTSCAGVRNVCAVGERLVLAGERRHDEAKALNLRLEEKVRDYVWGVQLAHLTARGTISAADMQPARYCALNSTHSGTTCIGDADAADDQSHWLPLDAARREAIRSQLASLRPSDISEDLALAFFPIYPQSWGETFGNTVLSLYELRKAGWIDDETQLLPGYSWYNQLLQPFSSRHVSTLQELEMQRQSRCYRRMLVCHLGSFVFDDEGGRGRDSRGAVGPERKPWEAMQFVVSRTGDPVFRRHVAARAASWRQPRLRPLDLHRVAKARASTLQLLLVERRGRRRIANVHQLGRACREAALGAQGQRASSMGIERLSSVHQVVCTVHSFGHEGFVADLQAARGADLMVGTHGADLVNSMAMHRGASVLEVWPEGFASLTGLKEWHRNFLALDDAIHHYTLRLGANETLTPPADAHSRPGSDDSWRWPSNFDVNLPMRALRIFVERVEEVNADTGRYRRLRRAGRTTLEL